MSHYGGIIPNVTSEHVWLCLNMKLGTERKNVRTAEARRRSRLFTGAEIHVIKKQRKTQLEAGVIHTLRPPQMLGGLIHGKLPQQRLSLLHYSLKNSKRAWQTVKMLVSDRLLAENRNAALGTRKVTIESTFGRSWFSSWMRTKALLGLKQSRLAKSRFQTCYNSPPVTKCRIKVKIKPLKMISKQNKSSSIGGQNDPH